MALHAPVQLVKGKSLYMSHIAHPARAYPSFCSMKQLGLFPLPPAWNAGPVQGYPHIK